jgi:hypothetical protein
MHQLIKFEGISEVEALASQQPHLLFLINNDGCTPLCMAINEQLDAKALLLIDLMSKHSLHSNVKYTKRPNRLELKFEKPFTLSVLKNNLHLI